MTSSCSAAWHVPTCTRGHDVVRAQIVRKLPNHKRGDGERKVGVGRIESSLTTMTLSVVLSHMQATYRLDVEAENVVEVCWEAREQRVEAPVLARVHHNNRPHRW